LRGLAFGLIFLAVSACSIAKGEGQSEIEITISNQSPLNICEVYVTKISANSWGDNLLIKPDTIPAGSERTFRLNSGTYDLLARTCAEEVAYSKSDIAGSYTAVIGGKGLFPVRAVNRSDLEICYIYATPAGAGAWGEDWLGSVETILPGKIRWFFFEEGLVNLRAEDCDHNLVEERDNFDPAAGLNWEIKP
jgi:hypothetical protein